MQVVTRQLEQVETRKTGRDQAIRADRDLADRA